MIPIVILTSNQKRHKFFANSLIKEFKVVGIVTEPKRPFEKQTSKEESLIIKRHFLQREDAENRYFGDCEKFNIDKESLLEVPSGEINGSGVLDWVRAKKPEYLILFGTGIVKPPTLSFFENRIINIHLGLSPYYRGSGTNFWPLVNREPECVGATIHLAVLEVDSGPILSQIRPEAVIEDRCHDLGCKTIMNGTKKMAESIKKYYQKKLIPIKKSGTGYLYKKSDFNAVAVEKMWLNFKTGMMREYLDNKIERCAKFPIINQ